MSTDDLVLTETWADTLAGVTGAPATSRPLPGSVSVQEEHTHTHAQIPRQLEAFCPHTRVHGRGKWAWRPQPGAGPRADVSTARTRTSAAESETRVHVLRDPTLHQGGRDNHGEGTSPQGALGRESQLEDTFPINHPKSRTEGQVGEDHQKLQGERQCLGVNAGEAPKARRPVPTRKGNSPGPSRALRTRLRENAS